MTPYFIPSLAATLINAEDKKGTPLGYEEVIRIRDHATCIMMKLVDARKMDESRGYIDVDPENLWYSWQMLRKELNRLPEMDPGPRFVQFNKQDAEYLETVRRAKETLSDFRRKLPQDGSGLFGAMLKIELTEKDNSAFIWLINTSIHGDGFVAEMCEVPKFFQNFSIGQSFNIHPDEIVDWMINDDGTIYGGFSLRYHRSKLSDEEKIEFDENLGANKYA
ncbi:MAG TPA: DUF2314 domain-containing protein [Fibrobacteria bacterium]|nr:DUF2314 domain-containing protein [Fibrobacteria bacterium]